MGLRRLGVVLVLAGGVVLSAQPQLPSEPPRQFGSSVTGAYEGWFDNADGSHNFLVGYLNRNSAQPLDIPIGPNNRIEPGGPDLGQPTHFLPGRQYGMFVITVPKSFGPQQRLIWTLVANGQTTSIPLWLNPLYLVNPFNDVAVKNMPPILRFEEKAAPLQGPIATAATARSLSTAVGSPLEVTVWASDDEKYSSGNNAPQRNPPPPVILTFSKYRGPGAVTFDKVSPAMEKLASGELPFSGRATATATFAQPGDYMLHVNANDFSGPGGGGEVCCWTTGLIKVTVTP